MIDYKPAFIFIVSQHLIITIADYQPDKLSIFALVISLQLVY